MERYYVVLLIVIAEVVGRIILGGDKRAGSVLSGGSFECVCDVKLEGESPGEGNPLGV